MTRIVRYLLPALMLLVPTGIVPGQENPIRRERPGGGVAEKDALEGHPAPELEVAGWLNTGSRPLLLDDLVGEVVVLNFWGSW